MKPLYKTSDWHLGVVRSAGTRPDTAYKLRQDLLREFDEMLHTVNDGNLLLNGDLFDTAAISMADLAQTFSSLSGWLARTGNKLYLPNGNHDISKNSTNFSSYEFLAKLLGDRFPVQVEHITQGIYIGDGCYVLPHVVNQDLLELELSKVPKCDYLFVHANYANSFAEQSDHSLSISEEQVKALPVKHVVFSHEHIGRTALNGKVVIVGNPRPSSVSDCLGNDTKRMLKITDDGMEFIETWRADTDFAEIDWRDLADTGARFIRVTGSASAAEAAQVVTTIAKFRAASAALVITNAVTVEGQDSTEEINLTHEQISNFNIMEALLKLFTPEEVTKIKQVMENRHATKT